MSMMTIDRAGPVLRVTQDYPRPGTQRAFLTIHVPARVNVRVDQGAPRTAVANVAAIEMTVRGETTLKKIAGRATVTHRGGRLLIEDVGSLKLSGRSTDASVSNVRGDASFSLQAGELTAASISGPIDLDAQNAEVTFQKLDEAHGLLRVSAVSGSVTLEGLTGDARIDGRNTEIEIAMSKAASVSVNNEGDEPVEITAPPGGFTLDALVTDGRLSLADDIREHVTTSGKDDAKEQRANGAVRGGGPTITLRANHGDIRVLTRETSKSER
jgi:hypothetical protein